MGTRAENGGVCMMGGRGGFGPLTCKGHQVDTLASELEAQLSCPVLTGSA